jgi:AbiV family abortive infection protein
MSRPSFKTFPSDTFLKGVECALTNSFELYNDAILLLNNGRLSRAYTLFQFSIEESGKTIFLLDLYTAVKIHENNPGLIDNKVVELHKELENKFYNHIPKTEHILKYELADMNKFIENFEVDQNAGIVNQRDGISKDLNSVKQLDNMKNQSLYTFIEANNFVLPSAKFDLSMINKIMSSALPKIMLAKNKTVRLLQTRQVPVEINIQKLEALKLDHPH